MSGAACGVSERRPLDQTSASSSRRSVWRRLRWAPRGVPFFFVGSLFAVAPKATASGPGIVRGFSRVAALRFSGTKSDGETRSPFEGDANAKGFIADEDGEDGAGAKGATREPFFSRKKKGTSFAVEWSSARPTALGFRFRASRRAATLSRSSSTKRARGAAPPRTLESSTAPCQVATPSAAGPSASLAARARAFEVPQPPRSLGAGFGFKMRAPRSASSRSGLCASCETAKEAETSSASSEPRAAETSGRRAPPPPSPPRSARRLRGRPACPAATGARARDRAGRSPSPQGSSAAKRALERGVRAGRAVGHDRRGVDKENV